jgi:hypothetical protein
MIAKDKWLYIALVLILLSCLPVTAQDQILIVMPELFVEEIWPLVSYKRASGATAHTATIETIDRFYTGLDIQEKIKRCIREYWQAGIDHVLLVGDCDVFPVRYIRAYNTEWGTKYYPSDLYYSDLVDGSGNFEDWDWDNDGFYGEMDFLGQGSPGDSTKVNLDKINMVPDVAVARVPASNETEVTTYVNKIIRYETKAPGSWFNEALLVVDGGAGPFGDEAAMNALVPNFSGMTVTKRYYDEAPWKDMTDAQRAAEINSQLNAGVGLVNYYGHGNRTFWSGWYGVNEMTSLTNTEQLPVIYAHSCYTGRFHASMDYYWTEAGTEFNQTGVWPRPVQTYPEPAGVQPAIYDTFENESMAEHLLVKRDQGAIAYIGLVSKSEQGGWPLDRYFFERWGQGDRVLGQLWKNALTTFVNNEVIPLGMDYYRYIHIHKVIPYGDTSLRVGGAFTHNLCGSLWDGSGGPLVSLTRHRVTCDIEVPMYSTFSTGYGVSLLFDGARKITARDTDPARGFIVNGASDNPVYFLSMPEYPESQHAAEGLKIMGRMKLRNGGQVKVY